MNGVYLNMPLPSIAHDLSDLRFCPILPSHIYSISAWTYEPPYDLYNLPYPPDADDVAYWMEPAIHAHAMINAWGILVAFCTFGRDGQVPGGDYSLDALDIGMGVRSDLTGQGRGSAFVQAACGFAISRFHPSRLRVTVLSENHRALRVWQKQGFSAVQQFTADHTDKRFDVLLQEPVTYTKK